jgi:hypothetical protein
MGIWRESVGLKKSKAQRDNNSHTMDALRIEFLHSFAVLGRCPSFEVIPGTNEERRPYNEDAYLVSQSDGLSDVGSPTVPSVLADIEMNATVSPVASIAQTTKQRRLDSVSSSKIFLFVTLI